MPKSQNQNYTELKRHLERLGGRITCSRAGSRHLAVYFETAKGNRTKLTLSKAPMRAGAVLFYLKRAIREADRS